MNHQFDNTCAANNHNTTKWRNSDANSHNTNKRENALRVTQKTKSERENRELS